MESQSKFFVWFCITHLTKAFRNALEGSQPGDPRSLEDKNDVPFEWAIIIELYHEVERMTVKNENAHNVAPLTQAVTYPKQQKRMNMLLAKISMLHKTVLFGIAVGCKHPLKDLTYQQLESATAEEGAKLQYKKMGDNGDHHPYERHGVHLVKVEYLQKHAQ